ncbi:hypothetical protein WL42_12435 [Burkholderia ubonensis]|nr:hypothetical protein WL42_12435 [Burkholderia ubonensis]
MLFTFSELLWLLLLGRTYLPEFFHFMDIGYIKAKYALWARIKPCGIALSDCRQTECVFASPKECETFPLD